MAGKRSNGEGSIRRLKSGNWQCEMMLGYTDKGKRNVIRFSGKTRSEVLQKMREYQDMNGNQCWCRKPRCSCFATLHKEGFPRQMTNLVICGYLEK